MIEGQTDRNLSPLPRLALQRDGTVVKLDDSFGDGQPQPRPTMLDRSGFLDSEKLLEDLVKIRAIDRNDALSVVADLPEMFLAADELAQKVALRKAKKPKQIVICGMGGSAISGNVVHDLLIDRFNEPGGEHRPVRRVTRRGRMALITHAEVIEKIDLGLSRYRPDLH